MKKESEDATPPKNDSLNAAWDHLMQALEMWEGAVWHDGRVTAGWALNTTIQARKLLQKGHLRLDL